MIDKDLLDILVCPENHTSLSPADDALLDKLNRAIGEGRIKNRGDQTVEGPLSGGLVRQDGAWLYPVVDDIPNLLVDEAISLDQVG